MCTVYRYVKFSRLVRILKKSKTPAEVISLQETWHGHNSWVIHDIELCGYRVIHKPRSNTQPQRYQRGGVATVCLDTRLKFSPITLRTKPSTMEYVVSIVQLRSHICRVLNVYRPGSRKATKIFFQAGKPDKKVQHVKDVLLIGDLNIAMNRKTNNAQELIDLLERCGLKQNVRYPTHEKGGLLDLVCSSDETSVRVTDIHSPSDHCLLTWFPFNSGRKRKWQAWLSLTASTYWANVLYCCGLCSLSLKWYKAEGLVPKEKKTGSRVLPGAGWCEAYSQVHDELCWHECPRAAWQGTRFQAYWH